MNRVLRFVAAGVLAGATLAAAPACASPRGAIYVRVGPPAPVYEVARVAPGPGYVWVPGFYAWNAGAYVWTTGRWVLPPRPRAVWIAGRWVHERRGWVWREGRWR